MSSESSVWRIHGVEYNLIPFLDEHPGGKDVLLTAMNQADAWRHADQILWADVKRYKVKFVKFVRV